MRDPTEIPFLRVLPFALIATGLVVGALAFALLTLNDAAERGALPVLPREITR